MYLPDIKGHGQERDCSFELISDKIIPEFRKDLECSLRANLVAELLPNELPVGVPLQITVDDHSFIFALTDNGVVIREERNNE